MGKDRKMSLKKRINIIYSQIVGLEAIRFEVFIKDKYLTDEELIDKYKNISNPHLVIFRI